MSLWGRPLGPLLTRATLPSTWYPSARRPAVFSLKKMNLRSSSEAGERHIRSDAEEDMQMLHFERICNFWSGQLEQPRHAQVLPLTALHITPTEEGPGGGSRVASRTLRLGELPSFLSCTLPRPATRYTQLPGKPVPL